MDKESGLAAVRFAITSGRTSQSNIATALGIDQSQVSRIAAGKFRRMSGHALNVCKYAYSLQAVDQANSKDPKLASDLERKVAQLITISPNAAEALTHMLDALIDELSPRL
jgi:hypothetical protein